MIDYYMPYLQEVSSLWDFVFFMQAECLTWKDLSESELVTILNAEDTWEIRR